MHHPSRTLTTTRSFEEKYLRFRTGAGTSFRAATGGEVSNGWTTVGQAEAMAAELRLGPGDRLLDVGSGRGWPGGLIAERTGAHLVAADVPLEALRQGAPALAERLGPRVRQICADGRALPIGDGHFSAVCHCDVLC